MVINHWALPQHANIYMLTFHYSKSSNDMYFYIIDHYMTKCKPLRALMGGTFFLDILLIYTFGESKIRLYCTCQILYRIIYYILLYIYLFPTKISCRTISKCSELLNIIVVIFRHLHHLVKV